MGSFDIYTSVGTEGRLRAIVDQRYHGQTCSGQLVPSSATMQAQLNLCHFVQATLKKKKIIPDEIWHFFHAISN